MNKVVKVTMDEKDIAVLDRQAEQAGVHRAELIRSRVFNADGERFSPVDYQRLVSDACRLSNLPRSQVERLVDYLFVRLLSKNRPATSLR